MIILPIMLVEESARRVIFAGTTRKKVTFRVPLIQGLRGTHQPLLATCIMQWSIEI
jgi:hypothetical protein